MWEQFAPYHVDRCAAVAARLQGRAKVLGIEIAPSSQRYAWEVSGEVVGAEKSVLFPGQVAETISRVARHRALRRSLCDADIVVLGLPSSDPSLAWLAQDLRRAGKKVYFCSDSKADDYPRSPLVEAAKKVILRSYTGGIVAGPRSRDYYLGLGVPSEDLWPGYDTVSAARIRTLAQSALPVAWEDRPFLFLGRFVQKKAVDVLLEAYAIYRRVARNPRGLVLAGDGPLRGALEAQADTLDVSPHIRWTGFLCERSAAHEMSRCLALVLPSREEQWGLVVNEAVALGIPAIASAQVGAVDLLVEEGVTGFVVATGSAEALAEAMLAMAASKKRWLSLAGNAGERDWIGDSERFADTLEAIATHDSAAQEAVARMFEAFESA